MKTKGCEQCILRPAGITKNPQSRNFGKPYESFYSCSNPECPNFKPKDGQYAPRKQSSIGIGEAEMINKRLVDLAQYLSGCHEEIMQKLIDIERK